MPPRLEKLQGVNYMKILQILPELNVGGVETGTVDFAKYLMAHGHQPMVVSNGGSLVAELNKIGVRHDQLPVHKKSLWSVLQCIKQLRRIILEENVDIVHARSRVPAWIAFFACRSTNAAFLTTCHGYYSQHFLSRVMGWGKLVIVPSEVIAKHMVDHLGVSPHDIRLIPRSVDLEKFHLPHQGKKVQGECVVSIVGRLTPLKGHPYFFKAMTKVVRSFPYVRILVIGDCPDRKESYKRELEVMVRHLGLSRFVEFLGNRRDIPELLAKTDVLVLSTITQEAFGRVILEAQAAGAAVVATRVGGVVEIIDHEKTGLLVPPKDPEAMADAVIRILNDRKLSEQLIAGAQKKLHEKFTLEHQSRRTLNVYEELLKSLNILVIKLSSIGDVILATASLRALRQKFPHAKIHCLVGPQAQAVLKDCPHIDSVIVFDPEGEDRGTRGLWRFAKNLRRYKFDKVIDFQNNRASHLLAFLSFPRESYGYNNRKCGFLLSHSIKDTPHEFSPVEHQFQILKMLGIEYQKDFFLEMWPSAKDEEYVQALLDGEWLGNALHIVGINLAASAKWETKNWPLEHIARLCNILSGKNIRVILTGTPKDKESARRLFSMVKSKPADFVGKTDIPQLAALIKRCQVFVTPDSAPMHVAAAVGTPFIAFFGPTEANRHLPPAKRFVVLNKKLPCSPCYSSHCRITTHACMNEILPEEVAKAVLSLMTQEHKDI